MQYYQGQEEYQGGPIDIINNLDSYIQLNKSGNLVGFTTLSILLMSLIKIIQLIVQGISQIVMVY